MNFQKKDKRIVYYCQKSNIGPVLNFQCGLKKVTTPFFSFLSDDDFLLPHFFNEAMEKMNQYADVAYFAGATIMCHGEKEDIFDITFSRWKKMGYLSPANCLKSFCRSGFTLWTSMLFRREIVQNIGFLDERIEPFDTDYVLRVIGSFPGVVSQNPCSVFRMWASGNSFYKNRRLNFVHPSWILICENFKKCRFIISEARTDGLSVLRRMGTRQSFVAGAAVLKSKDYDEVREIIILLKSFFHNKFFSFLLSFMLETSKKIPIFTGLLSFLLNFRIFLFKKIRKRRFRKIRTALDAWKKDFFSL